MNQRGGATAPAPDAGWGVEIALDVQAVSAACPHCKIPLVEADTSDFTDIGAAVNRALTFGAKIVSNSYRGGEYNGAIADGKAYCSHPGVAMVVSSGDNGFGPASFPFSWTNAIAVGGTSSQRCQDHEDLVAVIARGKAPKLSPTQETHLVGHPDLPPALL